MRTIHILFILVVITASCHDEARQTVSTSHIRMLDDTLLNANKKMIRNESQDIDDFIERYGWKMQISPTGLRYHIYHSGSGPQAVKGKTAVIHYTLRLLDGRLIDSTSTGAPAEFLIGYGGVASGLEEGILRLRKGSRARFILPAHLAFGLIGDQNKIPPRAALVYDLYLMDLKDTPRPSP